MWVLGVPLLKCPSGTGLVTGCMHGVRLRDDMQGRPGRAKDEVEQGIPHGVDSWFGGWRQISMF